MKETLFFSLTGLIVLLGLGQVRAAESAVETSKTPTTRLYVRTIPPGAEIKLNGEHRGFSDRLFKVPPGVRKMTIEVELDGHYPGQQEVEIRGGRITRVELVLKERPKDTTGGTPLNPFKDPPDRGPEQATGVPDTPRAGDFPTAWASRTADGQREWLLLDYAEPIKPTAVHVYETYNPGALSKITVFDPHGKEVKVWELIYKGITIDTTKGYPGGSRAVNDNGVVISKFPLKVDFAVQRVKLYFDSPRVKGWNEIDAVGLVDRRGRTHWATSAKASSTYVAPGPKPPEPVKSPIPEGAVTLSHVDDSAEGKRSIGGSGHVVAFDRPEKPKYVTAIQIFASRYGYPQPPDEDFHVYLLDKDQKVIKDLSYPYSMIDRGQERWYTLMVPTVEVPEHFYVALSFNPHRTKGIYLGIDENVKESHSYEGLPNQEFEKLAHTDWMVRACLLADPFSEEEAPQRQVEIPGGAVQLSHVDDSAEGKRSIGGSGHATAFDRPEKAKRVTAIQIYASRYGLPQPPAEDFQVYLLDENQKVVQALAYPYSMIERGRERWYTLEVPKVEVPEQFYVALSFNPHQTKGIYLGIDKNVKESHSYIGLPESGFEPVTDDYDWMVRVSLVPDAGAGAQSIRLGHVVVSSAGISEAYARAIARTVEAARTIAVEQFALDMPETVTVSVNCDPEQSTRLYTDGKDRVFLTVRSEQDLLKPSTSGVFQIYGQCHELGHMAMYRLIPNHSWLNGAAAEGWAHYLGSRIVDGVYAREGKDLWPDRYQYLEDGTQRLEKQLAAAEPKPVAQGAGLWKELAEIVGDKGVGPIFEAWGKVTVDPADPGKALGNALLATNTDQRLPRWWEKAGSLFVLKRPKSGFAVRTVNKDQLLGQPRELAHDDDRSAGKLSIAGSGHAVRFEAPGDSWYLTSVRIYGSRYGYPSAPQEDFHVWLCDKDFKLIADFPFPYASFQRAEPKWVTFDVEPTNAPAEFIVAVGFNPTATKGVYVYRDHGGSGKSLLGLPGGKAKPFTEGDWMIRAKVDRLHGADALRSQK